MAIAEDCIQWWALDSDTTVLSGDTLFFHICITSSIYKDIASPN
jgi:hypothetical protein